ncbi:MAG TPA: ribose-5-phosphate isomerase RpiA [Bauldia sp.]|nr:ribose-5-phosphate isomerase RpiA [Bauldia sp.]
MSVEKNPAGDDSRRKAGAIAAAEVTTGMKLGLGSGRTAEYFVRALGDRVKAEGLSIVGVPTSEQTAAVAREAGVPLTTLDANPQLDLAVDGADEVGPGLRLIKGGGGALLREKIVASAARRMIVVADKAKVVPMLGGFPLPIEVIPFGAGTTRIAIERAASRLGLTGALKLRETRDGAPYRTDGGNHIIDAAFGRIPDPDTLAAALKQIVGVVEHGLFIRLAASAIIADGDRVERLSP